mgnify:CR=1 FL=1
MAITKYDLDINKQAIIKPVVILRQGDHDIDTMQVSLSVANEPMDLTGATVTFMGNTANGRQIIDDAHVKIIDAKGGVFEYVFPSEASSDIGEYKVAYFSIILANGQSSTMDFRVQVLSGVDISAPVASEYISHYDTMVSELNSAYDSFVNETDDKMASTVSSLATSAATVLDSALARVNDVDSKANHASSVAADAVSMASSVASTVTSQASYINSVASSAVSNVSSVAAGVVDKLNNISVGGRNLLLDTGRSFTGIGTNQINGGFDAQNGKYYLAGGKKVSDLYNQYGPSGYLTISFDWVASGSTISGQFKPQWTSAPYSGLSNAGAVNPSNTNTSGHYKSTVPLAYGGYSTGSATSIGFRQDNLQGNITISNVKLEAGNIATDWTPAPEDADNTFLKKSGDNMTGTLGFGKGAGMKFGEAEFGYDGASDADGGNGGLYLKNKSSASVTGGIKHHISPVVVYPSNYLNMDTVTQTGTFLIRGNGAVIAPIFGVPTLFASNFAYGTLTVEANGAIGEPNQAAIDAGLTVRALTDAREIFRTDAATPRTWVRNRQGAGVWSPWREVDGDVLRYPTNAIWFGGNAQISRTGNIIHMQLSWNKTGGDIADSTNSVEKLPEWAWPTWSTFATVRYGEKYRGEVQINNDGTLSARGIITQGFSRVTISYTVDKPWPHSPLNPNNVATTLYPSNWTTEEIKNYNNGSTA